MRPVPCERALIGQYRDWLTSRGYSAASIRVWVGLARSCLAACDGRLPDTPEEAAAAISAETGRTSRGKCNVRTGMRRFYEFLEGSL